MKGIMVTPRAGISVLSMAASAVLFSGIAPAQTPAASAASEDALSEVVVTGTRIVRDGYTAPTPVTVVTTEELQRAAPSSIPDALNQLPQFSGSSNNTANRGGTATNPSTGNYLSLRNLGPIRTLVLLDGQRLPPTSFDGTVDANIIPSSLVSRIDVVTGGASAAYGSDAVSGVINFILDTKFSGIKGSAQAGVSDYSDGQSYKYSLAAGTGVNNDRGHFLFAYDHYQVDGIKDPLQRPLGAATWARTGAGTATNPFIDRTNVVLNTATFGTLFQGTPTGTSSGTINIGNPYRGYFFQPGGAIAPFNIGAVYGAANANLSIGGDGSPTIGRTLTGTQKTDQVFGRFDYSLTDNIDAFAQLTYAHNFNSYVSIGSGTQFGDFKISKDNAFLPSVVSTALNSCPGTTCDFTVAGRISADQPFKLATFYDDAATFVAGLKGKFGNYNWRAGYSRGDTLLKVAHYGNFDNAHWYAALDAVRDTAAYRTGLGAALAPGLAAPQGNIVCRVALTNPTLYPGCVPINIFGQGSPSQQAWDYVSQVSRYRVEQHMDIMNADISGDLFNLPAGPISWAAGAEYRKQSLDQSSNNDPSTSIPLTGLRTNVNTFILKYNSTNVGQAFGSQNIKEAFTEVAVPILKNSVAGSLDFNGAFRYTDYSASGNVDTWKVGLSYSPIDQLRFRATKSRDIRAPSLYDLFAGKQSTRGLVLDPHTGGLQLNAITYSQGNPFLTPEVGDTFTGGLVWMPTFAPGLSMSVDYYSIDIKDAIGTLAANDLLQQCEDSGGTANLCSFIQRPAGVPYSDRTVANFPISVSAIPFNQASQKLSGYDYEIGYRRPLGGGLLGPATLDLRLIGTVLMNYETQAQRGGAIIQSNNTLGNGGSNFGGVNSQNNNKNRFNLSTTYVDGPLALNLQARFYGASHRTQVATIFYSDNDIGSLTYFDTTVSYTKYLKDSDSKIEGFLTVNNLGDKQPPIIPGGGQPGQQYPTNINIYDVIGRYWTAGVRFKF